MRTGVILLAHGSKRAESNAVFDQLVTKVGRKIDYEVVQGAVMEFAEPKLPTVVKELVEQGIEKIIILPLFLFPGAHVKRYLPAEVEALKDKYQEIEFVVGDSLGTEEKLAELVTDKIKKVN